MKEPNTLISAITLSRGGLGNLHPGSENLWDTTCRFFDEVSIKDNLQHYLELVGVVYWSNLATLSERSVWQYGN